MCVNLISLPKAQNFKNVHCTQSVSNLCMHNCDKSKKHLNAYMFPFSWFNGSSYIEKKPFNTVFYVIYYRGSFSLGSVGQL